MRLKLYTALLLSLLCPSLASAESAEYTAKFTSANKYPIVTGMSSSTTYTIITDLLNINYEVQGDLYTGYETSLYEMDNPPQNVFLPTLYVEASAHSYFEVEIVGIAAFKIKVDMEGYRYNPVELQLVWKTNWPTDVVMFESDYLDKLCYGVGWSTRAMNARLSTEWRVQECQIGIIGAIVDFENDFSECEERRYVPVNPLFTFSIPQILNLRNVDRIGDYIDYTCLEVGYE
ncbi:hypothetical protein FGO68_gene2602 [Halteria grandinella]|uniref:Uncharacterized protein n=1 Tax=Halteria grandinella TaxID=5974 RepID=A0A8J8T267_HALGN|nr:hypothetical protein FGO68_gene2602 [Halteria grandinella]